APGSPPAAAQRPIEGPQVAQTCWRKVAPSPPGAAREAQSLQTKARASAAELPSGPMRVRIRYACTSACAGLILLGSVPSRAQTSPAAAPNRTVNLNYVYAAELGFGGYSLNGLTAAVYTLPLDYTVHSVLQDDWTLRILAPIQLGLYSLHVTDTNGE